MTRDGQRNGDRGDVAGDLFGKSFEEASAKLGDGRNTGVRYVGKYAALAKYLDEFREATCVLEFKRIEEILGSELPRSANRPQTGWLWWTNDLSRTQARNGWMAAGWLVSNVDYQRRVVSLRRES
ncbi:MAG: hypothetical protein OXC19_23920 [Bryobacterales bacterium]|nr:hypothetical protein [Bryobacterales bacterium]